MPFTQSDHQIILRIEWFYIFETLFTVMVGLRPVNFSGFISFCIAHMKMNKIGSFGENR